MANITNQQVKDHMGKTGDHDDDFIDTLIGQVEAMLYGEKLRGLEFGDAETERLFDAWGDVDGAILFFDKWAHTLGDVTNGDGVVVAASDYVTRPRNDPPFYAIELKSGSGLQWLPADVGEQGAISVEADWFWSAVAPVDLQLLEIRWVEMLLLTRRDRADSLPFWADEIVVEWQKKSAFSVVG